MHHFAEKYIALYPYQSAEPDDLCFDQNDVIKVIKKDGEWWTGVLNGKTGVFPSNYVQKMEYQVMFFLTLIEKTIFFSFSSLRLNIFIFTAELNL